MEKFHLFSILFCTYYLGLMTLGFWYQIPAIAFWLPGILVLFVLGYAAMNLDTQFYIKVICKGQSTKKQIALTFDDGPHPDITPKLLNLLKKHQIPATFFLIGKNLNGNEELVKRMDLEGHLIGNHSYHHSVKFDFFFSNYIRNEIQKTNGKIQEIIGEEVRFFRPPFGVTNPHISKVVKQEKLKVIGWNIRSFDAGLKDKSLIINRLKKNVRNGGILLFHDVRPICLEILKDFIPFLIAQGYEIISLEKLIDERAYA